MAFTLTLTGDKELSALFAQLPTRVQQGLIKNELKGVLKPVLAAAKRDARKKSGAMSRTLRLVAMKRKRGRVGYYIRTGTRAELATVLNKRGAKLASRVLGGGRYTGKTRRQLQVIGRLRRRLDNPKEHYYPAIIELGARGKDGRVHPAYSYLRKNFDAQRSAMEGRIIDSLNEAIEEAMRG